MSREAGTWLDFSRAQHALHAAFRAWLAEAGANASLLAEFDRRTMQIEEASAAIKEILDTAKPANPNDSKDD